MGKYTKQELFKLLREGPQTIRYTKRDGTTKAAVFSLEDTRLGDYADDLKAQKRRGPQETLRAFSITDDGIRTINVNKVKSVDATNVAA